MVKRYHSMTSMEYKFLTNRCVASESQLFDHIAEICFEEGWRDRLGNITEKGKVAVKMYEVFMDDDDDDIPWDDAVSNVLILDPQKLGAPAKPKETPSAVRGSEHLVAKETRGG